MSLGVKAFLSATTSVVVPPTAGVSAQAGQSFTPPPPHPTPPQNLFFSITYYCYLATRLPRIQD